MKLYKCIPALMLAILLLLSCAVPAFAEDIGQGFCGAGEKDSSEWLQLQWLYDDDHTLTFTGEGAMADYSVDHARTTAPWGHYMPRVFKIVVQDGVTALGNAAFHYIFSEIALISLPRSLERIGEDLLWAAQGQNAYFKTVISYAGSAEDWAKIEIAPSTAAALEAENYILTFNGDVPAPACKIVLPDGAQAGQFDYFTVYPDVVCGDHPQAKMEWDFGKTSREYSIFWMGREDEPGDHSTWRGHGACNWYTHYGRAGTRRITLQLVDPDGTVLASDAVEMEISPMPTGEKLSYGLRHLHLYALIPFYLLWRLVKFGY
ncbi:MAG: hypothetical protein IJK64_12055 [Clostridia bacterium]|nr:hypothetical protein [Clostridia bacterium]